MSLFDLLTQSEERRPVSVSELTAQIRRRLEGEFGAVIVQGEISNFKAHSSGHWYFTLKDDRAQIRGACFRNANQRIRFRPADGLSVIVRGSLSVYEPRGDYQLLATMIEPVGVGSLQLAFEQLKARLEKEGLFDPAHKRPIPLMPRRVGVVTSPTGAAVRDIIRVLSRRNDTVSLLLYPAAVEGENAAKEIRAGIEYFNTHNTGDTAVDVLIVGRGGGSAESLWAFNDEALARAIHQSQIPVISAVGHEVDYTIADFVADLRAPTPSAAAEMVAIQKSEVVGQLTRAEATLERHIRYKLLVARSRWQELARHQVFSDVQSRLRDTQQWLDELSQRLETSMVTGLRSLGDREQRATQQLHSFDWSRYFQLQRQRVGQTEARLQNVLAHQLEARQARLEQAAARLEMLSPLRVLRRGYALVWNQQGQLVKRAVEVKSGDLLRLRVSEGEVSCTVLDSQPEES
ncbi:MAG TPA: exodeoxyribonuclease VII large subunit [Acidobacteriota bacterium]|nr:exodeoxyribonuclease VII large subunit [Acidobacteriota bacterium]